MKRGLARIGIVALVAVVIAAATFWWLASRQAAERATPDQGPEVAGSAAGETALFFPGRGDRLYRELRSLPPVEDRDEHLRSVLAELLAGPREEGLYPVLPDDVEIGDVVSTEDGTVYIDLASKEPLLSGLGSKAELLSVYSLVTTTLMNEPRAKSVVLLWNGRQPPTLAGHVDTAHPLGLNRALLADNS